MTSRERVLKAFRHEIPDRTPIFEKLIKSPIADEILGRPDVATNFTYRMELLESGDWQKLVDAEVYDLIDLAKILKMDMVRLGLNVPKDGPLPMRLDENLWRWENDDCEHLTRYLPDSGLVEEIYPQQAQKSLQQLEEEMAAQLEQEYVPPVIGEDELYVFRKAREIMATGGLDLAIFSCCYAIGACTWPPYMLEWYRTNPQLVHRYNERQAKAAIQLGKRYIELGADILGLGGDFAGKHGPVISPGQYREFILPYIKEMADAFHQLGAFVTNASDGNLWSVIDDFLINSGVDGYEEIDVRWGMDLSKLKSEFGDRICFIGNIDCAYSLVYATAEQVRRETVECIEKGLPTGHILMSSNCIHQGVKLENFLAMLEAHREYFEY